MSGYLLPTTGTVTLRGRDITKLTPQQRVPLGLVRTFQNIRLFSGLTVLQNVMVGQHTHARTGLTSLLPFRTKADKALLKEARDSLGLFDLDASANRRVSELPYGLQKQLEMARAMATKPQILLLDEPAAGMTSEGRLQLTERIRQAARHRGDDRRRRTRYGRHRPGLRHGHGAQLRTQDHRGFAGRGPGQPRGEDGLPWNLNPRYSSTRIIRGAHGRTGAHGLQPSSGVRADPRHHRRQRRGPTRRARRVARQQRCREEHAPARHLRDDPCPQGVGGPQRLRRHGLAQRRPRPGRPRDVPEGRRPLATLTVEENLRLGAFSVRGAELVAELDVV